MLVRDRNRTEDEISPLEGRSRGQGAGEAHRGRRPALRGQLVTLGVTLGVVLGAGGRDELPG